MNKRRLFKLILLISWMFIIFMFSNQVSNESTELTNGILNFMNVDISKFFIPLRKFAHFFEYLVLGILVYCNLKEYLTKKEIFYSIIFCILYATSDEIHQLFIPGRSGQIKDVIIDSLGSVSGIIITKKLVKKT